jgi:hypothetical protein
VGDPISGETMWFALFTHSSRQLGAKSQLVAIRRRYDELVERSELYLGQGKSSLTDSEAFEFTTLLYALGQNVVHMIINGRLLARGFHIASTDLVQPAADWWRGATIDLQGNVAENHGTKLFGVLISLPDLKRVPRSDPSGPARPREDVLRAPGPSPKKKPGPKPVKREAVKSKMRAEIQNGDITIADLQNMKEVRLASRYGVNRQTARRAISEIVASTE